MAKTINNGKHIDNKNGTQMNVGMGVDPITNTIESTIVFNNEGITTKVVGKDMLVAILQKQGELENTIYHKSYGVTLDGLTQMDRCMMIKDAAYFVTEELHEMTREMPFMKHWKQYPQTFDEVEEMMVKAKKEYIDAVHFIMNIAVLFNMSPEEMYALYMDKNATNFDRQENNY